MRKNRILDTSHLIAHWCHARQGRPIEDFNPDDAGRWADELTGRFGCAAIVTPVEIEFLAGVRSQHEEHLARAYLARFEVVDDRRVLPEDWNEARRLASRVPRNRKRRHLGDCLIRAIATRCRREVITADQDFPR